MTLRVESFLGADVARYLPAIAVLRIEVFHDWPYLYDGSIEYEERYLASYTNPGAMVAIAFDGDVAPLHRLDFVGARDRDRLREGFAGVRRPAEVQFVGARTGEAGPADVDIPVVRSAGAIDLEHGLVLEDAADNLRWCPLADDDRPLIVDRIAAGVRCRAEWAARGE